MPDSANPPAPQFATLAVHAGAAPDPSTGARVTPIYQTTSYVFNDADHAAALFGLEAFGNIYTRIGEPDPGRARAARRRARRRHGGARRRLGPRGAGLVFHTLLEPGDEFVAGRQLYGGSVNQFNHSFKKFELERRLGRRHRPRDASPRRSRRRPGPSSASRSPIPAASSSTCRRSRPSPRRPACR